MKGFLLLLILFISSPILKSQELEFFREDIHFELQNSTFTVTGIYHFCNVDSLPLEKELFYPFPNDSMHGLVDMVEITNTLSKESIAFHKRSEDGLFFKVKLPPYGIAKYTIRYRQDLLGNTARYILTSTQAWDKPFEIVNYSLVTAKDLKIKFFSFPPDSISSTENNTMYHWKKKDFMPLKDFIITY